MYNHLNEEKGSGTELLDILFGAIAGIKESNLTKNKILLERIYTDIHDDLASNVDYYFGSLENLGLKCEESLLYHRFIEYWTYEVGYLFFMLINGFYAQIYRDLRFLLESCIQAYLIDHRYPLDSLKEKLDKGEMKLWGKQLFEKAFGYTKIQCTGTTYFQKTIRLNEKLSKRVHSSPEFQKEKYYGENIMEKILRSFFTPEYPEEEFSDYLDLICEVHRHLMKLFDSGFKY
ncbi:MAG: hypothetical protein ACFFCQ_12470 [Promethearchaeota archaeon]